MLVEAIINLNKTNSEKLLAKAKVVVIYDSKKIVVDDIIMTKSTAGINIIWPFKQDKWTDKDGVEQSRYIRYIEFDHQTKRTIEAEISRQYNIAFERHAKSVRENPIPQQEAPKGVKEEDVPWDTMDL